MKLSENCIITEVNGTHVAIPTGQQVADMGMLSQLNETGLLICECLKEDISLEELQKRLYEKFECNESEKTIINKDLHNFLICAKSAGLIEE